jgi:hypothetical protein
MILPQTRLHYINDQIGYGVFATEFIPKGTITYVQDALEPEISPEEFSSHKSEMRDLIEKYSYIDNKGYRIISWDFGKYVNHCCNANTMSTGYGFEIAIRDINPGEEITDEYGIFNMEKSMILSCKYANCRGIVCKDDFDTCYQTWDEQIKEALFLVDQVPQPLLSFMDLSTLQEVRNFLKEPETYKSVYHLKFNKTNNKTETIPPIVKSNGYVKMEQNS